MTQADQNNKIDALAAMASGRDIANDGFNAVEHVPDHDEDHNSDAANALAAQTAAAPTMTARPAAPNSASIAGARKARAATLQKQRSRVHAEQFKRMMVPILLVTGVLLMFLGAVVMWMMRDMPEYTGEGVLNNPMVRWIMVMTAFPLGAILLIGAWFFRADLKRGQTAAQFENARDDA